MKIVSVTIEFNVEKYLKELTFDEIKSTVESLGHKTVVFKLNKKYSKFWLFNIKIYNNWLKWIKLKLFHKKIKINYIIIL